MHAANEAYPNPDQLPQGRTGQRDWFAAYALAGLVAAPARSGVPHLKPEGMAKAAYELADAMLKQRNL